MQRTRTPAARPPAAPAALSLALATALSALVAGCVNPHLEGLATAECTGSGDCPGAQACIDGVCRVPDGPPDDGGPEAGADATPDAAPDRGLDATPDVALDLAVDMAPDSAVDGGVDMLTDGAPDRAVDMEADLAVDMAVDLAVDMTPDVGCVPMDEVCNGADDDCDEVVDESDDPEAPLSPLCDAPQGVDRSACIDGACRVQQCAAGRADVDVDYTTGCECVIFDGFDSRDLPEPLGLDANCDGAPGEAPVALFVLRGAPLDGDGSAEAPFATLDAALAVADGMEQAAIVVAPGAYGLAAPIAVDAGRTLVIVGGYAPEEGVWRRLDVEVPVVEIDGGAFSPAIDVTDGARFALDGIEMLTAGTSAPVGVRGVECAAIELTHSVLETTGPIGAQANAEHDGTDGRTGADAEDTAQAGDDGADDVGGGGGANRGCPDSGGGQGGLSLPNTPGDEGDPGADGVAQGGQGAIDPDTPARNGSRGRAGASGAAGVPASPAGQWNPQQLAWIRGVGQRPANGDHGHGGGGGGAGFGEPDLPGGGGGGGGGGGCGGQAGGNGQPGFGAFGIVAVGACAVVLEDSTLRVARGGDGGDGGPGGAGAAGRAGGAGGVVDGALQPAAAGGDGGNGGCGGDGAGGPGGPSVGILRVGAGPSPVVLRSQVEVADPSAGGQASSHVDCPDAEASVGAAGISLVVGCCPIGGGDCGTLRCDPVE